MVACHGRAVVLAEVSLRIDAGSSVALCGSNGAGKSTLARCVLGLHPLTSGKVRLDGVHATSRAQWSRRRSDIAYVPQRPAMGRFPLLVRELLDSSGDPGAGRAAAERLQVDHLLERSANTLSGGQLQRVMIARGVACVARGASVIVADEPTSALDFDGQAEVAEILTGLGVTALIISHEQVLVDRCDRVVEMAQGRLREVR